MITKRFALLQITNKIIMSDQRMDLQTIYDSLKLSPRKSPRKKYAKYNQYEVLNPWDEAGDAVQGYLITKKLSESLTLKTEKPKKKTRKMKVSVQDSPILPERPITIEQPEQQYKSTREQIPDPIQPTPSVRLPSPSPNDFFHIRPISHQPKPRIFAERTHHREPKPKSRALRSQAQSSFHLPSLVSVGLSKSKHEQKQSDEKDKSIKKSYSLPLIPKSRKLQQHKKSIVMGDRQQKIKELKSCIDSQILRMEDFQSLKSKILMI